MPTLRRWALVASFRFAKNDDDTPSPDELDEMRRSLEDAFDGLTPAAFQRFGIDDTEENRAVVYMLAVPATGSTKAMLEHGCRMFVHVRDLP